MVNMFYNGIHLVEAELRGLRYSIDGIPDATCLVSGRNAAFTCDVIGYSRPLVNFIYNYKIIDPLLNNRISLIAFDKVLRRFGFVM